MEYQKIINLIEKTNNQPWKFGKREWIKVNDDSNWIQKTGKKIRFYNSMLKSSDVYILVKGTITIAGAGVDAATQRAD